MYKSTFGIRNYSKYTENPFTLAKTTAFSESTSQTIKINKALFPKVLGLSRTGIRLLLYFIETNTFSTGIVYFNLRECKKMSGFGDKRSVYNGLTELLGENIIARTENENYYFLNLQIIRAGE